MGDGDPVALVERTVPVEVDGKRFSVRVWLPDLPVVVAGGGWAAGAGTSGAKRPRARASSGATGGGSGTVTAPMQGTIVKVNVEVGTTVAVDDTLLVLEAMKMEQTTRSPADGVVKQVLVREGDQVTAGQTLIVMEETSVKVMP